MDNQLDLLPSSRRSAAASPPADNLAPWELDEHTRQIGRVGLAAARQALQQASARLAA